MKIFYFITFLLICSGCQAQNAKQSDVLKATMHYELFDPQKSNTNFQLFPDSDAGKKATLCPAVLQSFKNLASASRAFCERKFDKSIGFENIEWSPIENKTINPLLIRDIAEAEIPDPMPSHWTQEIKTDRIKRYVGLYEDRLSSESSIFGQSRFDIDNNGVIDLVYKLEIEVCDESKLSATDPNIPLEAAYLLINNAGRLEKMFGVGSLAARGTVFRYDDRTYLSSYSKDPQDHSQISTTRHIAIYPVFHAKNRSANVSLEPLCVITEIQQENK